MSRKGENIFKRRDGRWEARYIHHYENGKAKYRYVYGSTYTEARAKKLAEQTQPKGIVSTEGQHPATFEQLAELWLSDIKIAVKESTYTRYYRIVYKYLIPQLRNQSLSQINQRFLNTLTERLLTEGGIHQNPLSPKTVSDILCVLKAIFKYGKANDYLCPNISHLRYPQKAPKKITILNDSNRQKIEEQILNSGDTTSLGIIFTLFTGVRIGELCGLRWGDIDFDNAVVSIQRTVERISDLDPLSPNKTKVVITEPKTEKARRVIPLPDFLLDYLKKNRQGDECYLITGSRKHTEPHQYYVRYQKFLQQHHIDSYTFHALRHTFATRCMEAGFDTKSLSEILGHASITTTLAIYVHPSMQLKKNQMERLMPSCISQSDM